MRISGVCISTFILGQKTVSDEKGTFQSLHGASGCEALSLHRNTDPRQGKISQLHNCIIYAKLVGSETCAVIMITTQ
ncbi:MAG TPA: hypothetical protein DD666_14745 [Advenella kashmirensis]|uniref:Uncharacterized protein n=1 Tax=Advenella kashmirensis TaxID=310575 RepID=A0A356LJH1_9BURK|nr:hypothetical protein [Advenella kashmirensis]